MHLRMRRSVLLLGAALAVALLAAGCLPAAPAPAPAPVAAAAVASPGGASQAVGLYPGYGNVSGLTSFESWLGRKVNYVVQFADANPANFLGSVWGEVTKAGEFQTLSSRLNFVESMPLAFGGGIDTSTAAGQAQARANLQATVNGTNDDKFRQAAIYLRDAGYGDAIIRLGWEFDVGYYPWSAQGNCGLFQDAFRHVHDVLRSVSPNFRFDWNPTARAFSAQTTCAYPGDAYVDIIGLDYYDKGFSAAYNASAQTWADPAGAFNSNVLPNVRQQRDFAIAHGKQLSYPEWAMATGGSETNGGGDDPTFVQGLSDWMRGLPATGPGSVAYHSYFNEDSAHDGLHVLSHFPDSQARYRALFGG
jgi:hypothetical protein